MRTVRLEIKSINPFTAGKIVSTVTLATTIVLSLVYVILDWLGVPGLTYLGERDPPTYLMFLAPLFYWIGSFLMAVLTSAFYNRLAPLVGGIVVIQEEAVDD